jgi:hypothetical protein
VLADYDGEMPEGHFVFAGGASSVTPEIVTIGAEDADARPRRWATTACCRSTIRHR